MQEVLMKTIGIIAEYNPFHNGHKYQIDNIKENLGADNIIIVMSGDFVQRGTPAWTDKYLRTQMALRCGADVVFELPVSLSTSSAETFAMGAVSLLDGLGVVDGLCFGSECGDISLLQNVAEFLVNPPASYDTDIERLVKAGNSYPAARQKILEKHFKDMFINYPDFFSSPNNILAIEYLKALTILNSDIKPVTIKRLGGNYHDAELSDSSLSSASAIRNHLLSPSLLPKCSDDLPDDVMSLLSENADRYPIYEDDFSHLLYGKLMTEIYTQADMTHYQDVSEPIQNRIKDKIGEYKSFSEFAALIKTRQYTYSRICRSLLHILLNIYNDPTHNQKALYARILGFKRSKSNLIKASKNKLPIITKVADGEKIIEDYYREDITKYAQALNQFNQSIYASDLYRFVQNDKLKTNLQNDYQRGVKIL